MPWMPRIPFSRLRTICFLSALGLGLSACNGRSPAGEASDAQAQAPITEEDAQAANGAVSSAPVQDPPVDPPVSAPRGQERLPTDWPSVKLESGEALVSCQTDYATQGDGERLESLAFFSVVDALSPCQQSGVVRLRYKGKIAADFTEMMIRVADVAERMGIDKRILDIDSAGGQVEDAIKAGDAIGASHWNIWVREKSVCHSACVFVLGAGDNRLISGKVGIHRIIRMSSTATTRSELNQELRGVYSRVEDYLERNGVAVAVADLMMTVPNRKLRLLSKVELQEYGLDGTNAAQDDLDRLQLMRRCGEAFVLRKDAFIRAFDSDCKAPGAELDQMQACGLALRERFDFPDNRCPADSPFAEFDRDQQTAGLP
jgi:hypothetical protein